MTDPEFRRQLDALDVPAPASRAREQARYRATLVLGRGESRTDRARAGQLGWWAAALLMLLAGVWAGSWHFQRQPAEDDLALDQKILQQMQALFPNQVDAVVEDRGQIKLSIAQSPEIGTSQPVVIRFRRDRRTIRVLSYSGHQVCLTLDGREHCFEILITPAGGVLLEGHDQAWLASALPSIEGYRVSAQSLEAAL